MKNKGALFLSAMLLFSSVSYAELSHLHRDLHNVEGEYGVLHFFGGVMVSPCILSSESQEQGIDMGNVTARYFKRAGDRSPAVIFTINIRDCLAGVHESHADIAGYSRGIFTHTYTSREQLVSLRFAGESDFTNPELLKIDGRTQGLGLRLLDNNGNPLALNQAQHPYLLPPGDSNLTFRAMLESTRSQITAGDYQGTVHLMMEYL